MSSHTHHGEKPFSALLFFINIVLSVVFCLGLIAMFLPSIWKIQINASWNMYLIVFVSAHFCFALFEHFFHRYVLHARLIPGLALFYKSHTKHHALTSIVLQKGRIRNVYPIIEEKQYEGSFFPWYSYVTFAAVVFFPLLLMQYVFSNTPIFIGGYTALAWSLILYEILHAFEHKPLEFWEPKLEHPNAYKRRFWRKAYAFHLRHHADIKCNEGISGFFGIPVADFLFGTWVDPETLYPHGSAGLAKEFISPRPIFFIRWLDMWADKRMKKLRAH
jgi:hemolysin III